MTPENIATVSATIEQAFEFAEKKQYAVAVRGFATVRSMIPIFADPHDLKMAVSRDALNNQRERDHQRKQLSGKFSGDRKIVLISDSLGLPRPEEKEGREFDCSDTFSSYLGEVTEGCSIDSICQRFATTNNILRILNDEADLGRDSDVVIHIGLNDCANRMFLTRERIAMSLLPKELNNRIVEFARRFRAQILTLLPPYHYVDPARFRSNLETSIATLRKRNVKKIVLTTIILPPAKFWRGTPGMNRNFGQYNQIIMDVCNEHKATLFDFDRHVWGNMADAPLISDGMHLSHNGHRLFSDQCALLLG